MNSGNVFNRFKGALAAAIFATGLTAAAVPNEADASILTLTGTGGGGEVVGVSLDIDETTLNTASGLPSGSYLNAITAGIINIDGAETTFTTTGNSNSISAFDSVSVDTIGFFYSNSDGVNLFFDWVALGNDMYASGDVDTLPSTLSAFAAALNGGLLLTGRFSRIITTAGADSISVDLTNASVVDGDLFVAAVPLPGAVYMLGAGLLVLGGIARRRRGGAPAIAA